MANSNHSNENAHRQTTGENPLNEKQKKDSTSLRKRYELGGRYQGIYFTAREMDVSILLLEGLTYKHMGKTLKLSERTIEFYVKQIKLKLNCEKRRELIQRLTEIEIIRKQAQINYQS